MVNELRQARNAHSHSTALKGVREPKQLIHLTTRDGAVVHAEQNRFRPIALFPSLLEELLD